MSFLLHSEPLGPISDLQIDRQGELLPPTAFYLGFPGLMSMAWISQPAHQLALCPARADILGLGLPVS